MRIFEGFQKGVNLGGWISQFAEYDLKHFDTFITEKDIADIAALGFDHVRVPVDYNVLEDEEGNPKDTGFLYLTRCHEWCERHGLHMLIDLHETFGFSFDPLKRDMDRKAFFYSEALQARFFALWRRIAETFRDDAETIAFEPLNEVTEYEVADAWNDVVDKYIRMIREICPNHYIVVGGVCYNSVTTLKLLDAPKDDRIVYNFHCYEPLIFTHQGAYWLDNMPSDFRVGYPESVETYRAMSRDLAENLAGAIFDENAKDMGPAFFENIFAPAIAHAEKNNAPMYCGEYGVIDLAANPDKIRWLTDIHQAFRNHSIGHALWNYKEKDFGFVNDRFASVRDDFIACL